MKIALLIDVDNYKVTDKELNYLINRLNMKGEVIYGKVYNYSDRLHKELSETIEHNGFDTAMQTVANKKTKKSVFDMRIALDAVKICCTNNAIEAFCLACGDGDIIPLISMLRAEGKIVLGCFNSGAEANERMCNEVILLNRVSLQQSVKNLAKAMEKKSTKVKTASKTTKTQKTEIKPVKTVEPAKVVATSRRETSQFNPQSPERWERVERKLDEVEKNRPAWMDEYEDDTYEETIEQPVTTKKVIEQTIVREKPVTNYVEETKKTVIEEPVVEEEVEEEPIVEETTPEEVESTDVPRHRFNAQNLAAQLESFARRTAALNFDSGEDIEEKKQLLAEIDECLNDEEFQDDNLTPDEEEAFNEIKSLVESLKETIQNSID